MESTLMVLVTAASLIEKPGRWCQRAFARAEDDEALTPGTASGRACAWCVDGALIEARNRHTADIVDLGDVPGDVLTYARHALAEAFMEDAQERRVGACNFHHDLWGWNDDAATTHDDVLRAFALAIANERGAVAA